MSMSDNDYVREAVRMADGFSVGASGTYYTPQGNAVEHQAYIDALAAQLVRQVDATDYEVRMQSCATTIFYAGDEFWQLGGKGRTMNTIRAIVDSKVLE